MYKPLLLSDGLQTLFFPVTSTPATSITADNVTLMQNSHTQYRASISTAPKHLPFTLSTALDKVARHTKRACL